MNQLLIYLLQGLLVAIGELIDVSFGNNMGIDIICAFSAFTMIYWFFYSITQIGVYGYNIVLKNIKCTMIISFIVSVISGIIMIAFKTQFSNLFYLTDKQHEILESFIIAKALFLPVECLCNLNYRYMIVKMMNKYLTICNIMYYVLLIGFDIIVFSLGINPVYLIYGTGLTYVICYIVTLRLTHILKDSDKVTLVGIREQLYHAVHIFIERIMGKIVILVYNICASKLGTEAYALHSIGFAISTNMQEMSSMEIDYTIVMLHDVINFNDKVLKMKEMIKKNFIWVNFILIVAALIMVFPLKGEVNLLDSITVTLLYMICHIPMYFDHFYNGCVMSMGKSKCIMMCGIIRSIMIIPVIIILVSNFELVGFAASMCIDYIIRCIYYKIFICRYEKEDTRKEVQV